MPHKGRLYPVLNRYRFLQRDTNWPRWLPTEYTVAAPNWLGLAGGSAPSLVRGNANATYFAGETTISYEFAMGTYLGLAVTMTFNWHWGGVAGPDYYSLVGFYDIANCWSLTVNPSVANNLDVFMLNRGNPGYSPGPAIAFFEPGFSFITVKAVPWSASPAPLPSTPF